MTAQVAVGIRPVQLQLPVHHNSMWERPHCLERARSPAATIACLCAGQGTRQAMQQAGGASQVLFTIVMGPQDPRTDKLGGAYEFRRQRGK